MRYPPTCVEIRITVSIASTNLSCRESCQLHDLEGLTTFRLLKMCRYELASLDAAAGVGSRVVTSRRSHFCDSLPFHLLRGVFPYSSRVCVSEAVGGICPSFGARMSSLAHRNMFSDNSIGLTRAAPSLGLRGGSAGTVVFYGVASPGVGHAAHLFGIPCSDLVDS